MQKRKKLFWRIYPSYLFIALLSLAVVVWHASKSLRQFHLDQASFDLEARALLIERLVLEKRLSKSASQIDALCKDVGPRISTRITVISPSGEVIADSVQDPSRMGNHASYPEFQKALSGGVGVFTGYSFESKKEMIYVAVPVEGQRKIEGVIRVSVPLASIGQILEPIYLKIAFGGLLFALIAIIISLIISRPIDVPLEEMEEGAHHFASGNLDYRLPMSRTEELGSLAETMNRMAARLNERLCTITQQKNELETVLSSMDEAVLVVDMNERIIRFNQAAAHLFKVKASSAQGRSIQEVIRNTDLQHLVTKTLSSQEPVEGDIVLYNGTERFLQAHGTILRDLQGSHIGALIVLNNITRLKVLENIRRDFVANVSHELKTPITSIKGFVETLRDGAVNSPDDRMKFLDIIARHADRLNAIIDDLLSLSRIEQEAEREQIALEEGRIKDALDSAILVCTSKADEKGIRIDLACDQDLKAMINPPLLEQAVVNLIDNAIKYSGSGSTIKIEAARIAEETVIKVRDWGCGIPQDHLQRIFERFYRVDKARSRKLGGTGLGLAIVKHIVHAHGGRILVESTPGQGSTFSICLPIKNTSS
ncbi:MAG: two-component system histidine kinase PnpS [bacterium]